MKLGIMQPYLFPYIGYFQLINTVDKFVIYDDVQYIKAGWINRNRILVNQHEYLFTFSLKQGSTFSNINERYFSCNFSKEKNKFLKTLKESYGKTENYMDVSNLVEEALNFDTMNISKSITKSIKVICSYLELKTSIIFSSDFEIKNEFKGVERIIEINKQMGSNHYINSIGGRDLYSKEIFLENDINLSFLKTVPIKYKQFNELFVPNLSIIDILMFNSKDQVLELLNRYELI